MLNIFVLCTSQLALSLHALVLPLTLVCRQMIIRATTPVNWARPFAARAGAVNCTNAPRGTPFYIVTVLYSNTFSNRSTKTLTKSKVTSMAGWYYSQFRCPRADILKFEYNATFPNTKSSTAIASMCILFVCYGWYYKTFPRTVVVVLVVVVPKVHTMPERHPSIYWF